MREKVQNAKVYALSVKQPWASSISRGSKRTEFRTWRTHHRGPLLIVASASPKIEGLPTGVALCVVDVTDVIGSDGAWSWKLARPREVVPFAVRGFAALYKIDDARIVFSVHLIDPERMRKAVARAIDGRSEWAFVDASGTEVTTSRGLGMSDDDGE